MGLVDSTQNVSNTIQEINSLTKEKESEKMIKSRLKRDLKRIFFKGIYDDIVNEIYDDNAINQFYNMFTKDAIISRLGRNDYECEILEEEYNKVLNRVKRDYDRHIKEEDWYFNNKKQRRTEREQFLEKIFAD